MRRGLLSLVLAGTAGLSAQQTVDAVAVAAAIARLDGADGAAAHAMAATIRHQWAELPQALFDGLVERPKAARWLLEQFAAAPRPAAHAFVAEQARSLPGRSHDHRLLALAARLEEPDGDDARLLLASLADEAPGDGFYRLASRLPSTAADRLVGRMHAQLMAGQATVLQLAPIFDRLSPNGTRALLGLASTLPRAPAFEVLRYVHEVRPELVRERIARTLDEDLPIEARWLRFAGPVLDRPERVRRVRELLRDPAASDEAFAALLAARAIDDQVLELAQVDDRDDRRRSLLQNAIDLVPAARVVAWLQRDPETVAATAQALTRRRALEPSVQAALLALLDGLQVVEGHAAFSALTALVRGGDAAALRAVWPAMFRSARATELLYRLEARDEPFVTGLLQRELDQDLDRSEQQLDMVRLLLCARGEGRGLDALLAHAPRREPAFVRRCRAHVRELAQAQVQSICDAALAHDDADVMAALLEWAVVASPELVGSRLWPIWRAPPPGEHGEELLAVAVRLLCAGPRRPDLVAELRQALDAGPLPGRLASLPYELLDSMREPLDAADVTLCAAMLLRLPLADPDGERRRVLRWPGGRFGFPLVTAIANRLRDVPAELAVAAFDPVVRDVLADERHRHVSRQRLAAFWRALAPWPELQQRLGGATVSLYALPDAALADALDALDATACWLTACERERCGGHAEAAELYRRARSALLCRADPELATAARWLLGDRDPAAGVDPHARLAAAPHRMQRQLARRADDAAAAAAAARLVREFAGHDQITLATLSDPTEETGR